MTESPFDGMTNYKAIGMMGKCMKKRWQTTESGRMAALDFVERVVEDDQERVGNRLKAVELMVKFEAMNQTDERIAVITEAQSIENNTQRTILILPPNGTEIRKED